MTAASIGLLVALAPAIISLVQWLLKRSEKKPVTPSEQHKTNEQEINKIVATGDERGANVLVDDLLNRMQKSRQVRSDNSGQGSKEG